VVSTSRPNRALAHQRASFLGESRESARSIVGARNSPRIDECSAAQRDVRALMAMYALNHDPYNRERLFNDTALAALTTYDFILSPRHDELVIVSNAPDNIAHRLLGSPLGLRFVDEAETEQENRIYRMAHFSSGARVTSTSAKNLLGSGKTASGDAAPDGLNPGYDFAPGKHLDRPLTPNELASADWLGKLNPDFKALLAGLFVRLCAREIALVEGDDRPRWAVGNFYWDPLRREPAEWWARQRPHSRVRLRRLRSVLELRWSGPPFPSDIADALTDPVCGLRGATARPEFDGREYIVTYGRVRLLLRPF